MDVVNLFLFKGPISRGEVGMWDISQRGASMVKKWFQQAGKTHPEMERFLEKPVLKRQNIEVKFSKKNTITLK